MLKEHLPPCFALNVLNGCWWYLKLNEAWQHATGKFPNVTRRCDGEWREDNKRSEQRGEKNQLSLEEEHCGRKPIKGWITDPCSSSCFITFSLDSVFNLSLLMKIKQMVKKHFKNNYCSIMLLCGGSLYLFICLFSQLLFNQNDCKWLLRNAIIILRPEIK